MNMDWVSTAACRGMDPNVFFPERGRPLSDIRAICAGCPASDECLEYALANNEHHGVWGGMSERQRRTIRRVRTTTPRRSDDA